MLFHRGAQEILIVSKGFIMCASINRNEENVQPIKSLFTDKLLMGGENQALRTLKTR